MAKRAIRNGKASQEAMDTGAAAAEQPKYEYAGGVAVAIAPKAGKGRKSILKLSRKQKLRKAQKAEKAENTAGRAAAKGVRDVKKLNRRLHAKTMW